MHELQHRPQPRHFGLARAVSAAFRGLADEHLEGFHVAAIIAASTVGAVRDAVVAALADLDAGLAAWRPCDEETDALVAELVDDVHVLAAFVGARA